MKPTIITPEALDFLTALGENNNREWFAEQKMEFKKYEDQVKVFYKGILDGLNQHDEIERMKVFRIHRDIRFSKDKTPYKVHFAASFSRAGAHRRGGYYIHIKPGGTFIATGFWNPNKEDLLRIRKEFQLDATEFRDVISEPGFKKIWGALQGDEVKTAPKGFDKQDPNIDLIKRKQFIFIRSFTNQGVLSSSFMEKVSLSFQAIRPYFDVMSTILTTNLNGESLID